MLKFTDLKNGKISGFVHFLIVFNYISNFRISTNFNSLLNSASTKIFVTKFTKYVNWYSQNFKSTLWCFWVRSGKDPALNRVKTASNCLQFFFKLIKISLKLKKSASRRGIFQLLATKAEVPDENGLCSESSWTHTVCFQTTITGFGNWFQLKKVRTMASFLSDKKSFIPGLAWLEAYSNAL